jgi:predicted transcriptional regulator
VSSSEELFDELNQLYRAMHVERQQLTNLRRKRQQTLQTLVDQGWSQTRLAKELGVTRARIYQYLTEFDVEEARNTARASVQQSAS